MRCIKFSNYTYENCYTYTTVISLPRHTVCSLPPAKQIKKLWIMVQFLLSIQNKKGPVFYFTLSQNFTRMQADCVLHRTNVEAWNLSLQNLCRNNSTMKKYLNYGKSQSCVSSWLSKDNMHVTVSNCTKLKSMRLGVKWFTIWNDKHTDTTVISQAYFLAIKKVRRLKISSKLK